MSRRFSQLWAFPSRSNPPFPSDSDDEIENVKISLTERRTKRQSVRNIAILIFSRRQKKSTAHSLQEPVRKAVIVQPRPSLVIEKDPQHSRHDSKFSSISSSLDDLHFSKTPLLQKTIYLSAKQFTRLQRVIQKLGISLKKEEAASSSFTNNLLWLMAVKERSIKFTKRLNIEWKEGLTKEMDGVRDELGRVFTRKAALLQRSQALVSKMEGKYGRGVDVKLTEKGTFSIEDATMKYSVSTLKKDTEMQKSLNEMLLDVITRKCWRDRWVRTGSQRIEMRRFVAFAVGRVEALNAVEEEILGVLEEVEGLVGRGS